MPHKLCGTKLNSNKYAKPNLELICHFLYFALVFLSSTLTTFVQYSTGIYIYSTGIYIYYIYIYIYGYVAEHTNNYFYGRLNSLALTGELHVRKLQNGPVTFALFGLCSFLLTV